MYKSAEHFYLAKFVRHYSRLGLTQEMIEANDG